MYKNALKAVGGAKKSNEAPPKKSHEFEIYNGQLQELNKSVKQANSDSTFELRE